jgi:predicted amino acid dehydrogenase
MSPRAPKLHHRTKPKALPRFQVVHHADRVGVELNQPPSNEWVTIAAVHGAAGFPASDLAARIARLLNQDVAKDEVLQRAAVALDEILRDGLTFSTEQAIEHTANNIRRILR